jgi:pimeloyl-ACP methyl ester carboxylesterase
MTIRDTDLKKFSSRQELENYIINKVDDIRIMQFLSKNIQRNSNNIFEWKFYAEGIIENIAYMGHAVKKYNTFTKPTIFIRGGKSKFITENDYSIIADYYPQATIQVIPNAGHWVHADEPVEFMKQILTFLGLEKFL